MVDQPTGHEPRADHQWVVDLRWGDLRLNGREHHPGSAGETQLGVWGDVFEERVFGVPGDSAECWVCGAVSVGGWGCTGE